MKCFFILIILFFSSCCYEKNDTRTFEVLDFSKERIDTLIPLNNKSYVSYFIKVKGFSNDTILFKSNYFYDIKLSGEIDTIISGDYYGKDTIIISFKPYKAINGNLKIKYSL